MMKIKNQSSTLEITIAVVVIASMLALSVIVLVTQEADAAVSKKVSIQQTQVNKCTESAKCNNIGTVTFGSGVGHSGPGHH
jgi:hypothetical protein